MLGSIVVPGGTISIKGSNNSNDIFEGGHATAPLATVYLGPNTSLSTAGTTVLTPDVYGLPTGVVLPGGSISISGNIVAAAGSKLDVSGTSGVIYVPQSETTLATPVMGSFLGAPVVPVRVDSNGGSITLAGGQELFSDAILLGAPGGPTAIGGSLTVSSGRWAVDQSTVTLTPTDPTLTVTQGGPTMPVPVATIGGTGVGQPTLGIGGNLLAPSGGGYHRRQ